MPAYNASTALNLSSSLPREQRRGSVTWCRAVAVLATAVILCACAGLVLQRLASLERRVNTLTAQLEAALGAKAAGKLHAAHKQPTTAATHEPANLAPSENSTPDLKPPTATPARAETGAGKGAAFLATAANASSCVKSFKTWSLDDALADVSWRFGIPSAVEYDAATAEARTRAAAKGTVVVTQPYYYAERWWNWLSNPHRYQALANAQWRRYSSGGATATDTLASPVAQEEPAWPQNEGPTYFAGYTYSIPIQCPGTPYACGGHGVCDSARGACVCRPPWTGWACKYNYLTAATVAAAAILAPGDRTVTNEWEPGQCGPQIVTDPKVEKWDKRAAERCRAAIGNTKVNGMWLGLTQNHSRAIALSLANVLGVRNDPNFVLFDIGMGCGDMLRHISVAYPNASLAGVDYSKAAVELVRERFANVSIAAGHPRHDVLCVADVRNLSFIPSNSVDAAYESGVFSVTRDGHCHTYRESIRVLKPGGTLLIHQTYHDGHTVKCWQNVNMQSVERCLGPTGVLFEHVLTRDLSGGAFDTYCAGETWAVLVRKPLHFEGSGDGPVPWCNASNHNASTGTTGNTKTRRKQTPKPSMAS